MRRRFTTRLAAVCLCVFTVLPLAASPNDDSPIGGVERAIVRVMRQLQRVLHLSPLDEPGVPKP